MAEPIIRRMPPDLANKIAAGEVVQRPASVVRELLDNAIDSGADQIGVVIKSSGKSLIQVTDNGCGMGPDDLRLCLEPHATSKLQSIEDLQRILTLGFRGEAMASMASVAQIEVRSRLHDEPDGHRIEVHGGEETFFGPAAGEPGTTVSVRNLFYNVPARRQFLKTDPTEFRYILRAFQEASLARTDIAFTLHADGNELHMLPPQSLVERIAGLFGGEYRASMIPLEESAGMFHLEGVLSDPKLSRRSRGEQFLFVNGRSIQHRSLTHQILRVYQPWLRENEYPFFALFLRIDPDQVDVNVHPAKAEVKLADERSAARLVQSVVRKGLHSWLKVPDLGDRIETTGRAPEHPFRPSGGEWEGRGRGDDGRRAGAGIGPWDGAKGGERRPAPNLRRISDELYASREGSGDLSDATGFPRSASPADEPVSAGAPQLRQTAERVGDSGFWQLHGTYIVTQTRSGFCLIDQHAAHKRIVYEKALSATEEALPGTQQLLFSQTVELSASDFSLLQELLPVIQRMGFALDVLGGNMVMVTGVPADLDMGDEKQILSQLLQQYRALDSDTTLDRRRKVAIAFASRSAIPRGRRLQPLEMENIVDQLFACQDPYQDPLGRPTLVYWTLEDLESRFKTTTARTNDPRSKPHFPTDP